MWGIHEVIDDSRSRQLYSFLSDQQSKYNWILIFIPIFSFFIFPGDISDFFPFIVTFRERIKKLVEHEQFTRSNALTARLPTLVRLAETLTRDWLQGTQTATRNGDASNHIAVHHQLTNHDIDWDSAQCLTYSTNYFQRLTLESWYTNLAT